MGPKKEVGNFMDAKGTQYQIFCCKIEVLAYQNSNCKRILWIIGLAVKAASIKHKTLGNLNLALKSVKVSRLSWTV